MSVTGWCEEDYGEEFKPKAWMVVWVKRGDKEVKIIRPTLTKVGCQCSVDETNVSEWED